MTRTQNTNYQPPGKSAISTLTSAKDELTAAPSGKFPSEKELLDAHFGTMLPLRNQPILFAKFSLAALRHHDLTTAPLPALDIDFTSLQDAIDLFTAVEAAFAAVDEEKFNAAAETSFEIPFPQMGKTMNVTGMADYFHGFLIPHDYFHVNAIYMLLRSQGFALGKPVYVGAFMTESLGRDFAVLRK
jgi:hypothetical protein